MTHTHIYIYGHIIRKFESHIMSYVKIDNYILGIIVLRYSDI